MSSALFLLFSCTSVHCLYSFMGSLYVGSEVPRIANEQLLDNLKEGVFIVEKDCSGICFLNSAAKNFMSNPNFDVSKASDLEDTADDKLFDWDKKMFAKMDTNILSGKNKNIDTVNIAS